MSPQTPTLESTDPQGGPGTSSSPPGGVAGGEGISKEAYYALQTYKQRDSSKVVVRFKATGSAPVMKQNFFKITASNRFQTVIAFLRKELGCKSTDSLFLYINAAFSPSPDETVSSLYKNFATDKQLIVNYSVTAAWG